MPINSKLDALPTKRDIENSMQIFEVQFKNEFINGKEKVKKQAKGFGFCKGKDFVKMYARAKEKVERVCCKVNDLAQYIRRFNLCIFGVSTYCFHERTVKQWALQYEL